jgi:hypothetical protein
MERKSIMKSVAALALAGLVFIPLVASAYLLPADAILSTAARKRAELAFTTIVAEGTFQRGDGPPLQVWEAVRANKAHRIERRDGNNTEVALTVPGKRYSFKTGERAPAPQKSNGDLIFTFFASTEREPGRTSQFLRAHDIDDNVVSLSRLDGRVAYVIGAKPWELNKSQLWIDKDLFLPIRLIHVDRQSGSVTDTRFLGVGSALTSEWFPQRIELWKDGKLVESTTYSSARLNEEVSEDLFRPPA